MSAFAAALFLGLAGCSPANVPDGRGVNIPTPTAADARPEAINERPDSVLYLPLGSDVLLPAVGANDPLPTEEVGPFELRSETLAGALQLILGDYEVPLAFETEKGLTQRITVANLHGPLSKVVKTVCGLADLYCSFNDGLLIVKDRETFTVKIPPISQDESFMQNVSTGLQAIIGTAPIVDQSTRTIIYQATNRNAEMAERYFQRMRSSTALIVFETYIWEVLLNDLSATGINWSMIDTFGKFNANFSISSTIDPELGNPVSIGLPTTQSDVGVSDVFDFLSSFGAVKTVSQPQITVLSGSKAHLKAADTRNYVSRIAETIDNGQTTTSVETGTADTGFTLDIASAWDNATIYADIEILLTEVSDIDTFDAGGENGTGLTRVQLPRKTERELTTQVRIRPGDSLLIAGLVRESDTYDTEGPGIKKPIIPTSRNTRAQNLELVFMLKPRVIVFSSPSEERHYGAVRKAGASEQGAGTLPAEEGGEGLEFTYDFAPIKNSMDEGGDSRASDELPAVVPDLDPGLLPEKQE